MRIELMSAVAGRKARARPRLINGLIAVSPASAFTTGVSILAPIDEGVLDPYGRPLRDWP